MPGTVNWVLCHVIGPVGLMSHQDNRFVRRDLFQREIELGLPLEYVIHSTEQKSFHFAFERDGPVAQKTGMLRELQDTM